MTCSDTIWHPQWAERTPMLAPLRALAQRLPPGSWPDVQALNEIAAAHGECLFNSRGVPIRFVPQPERLARFEDRFEPRTWLRGEVMVRGRNWHDLFNALVWMAFPASKAALNARQYASLSAQSGPRRSPAGDALTMFDEDGVVVLSSDGGLLELLRRFRWKELFWQRRDAVRASMRFVIFGHAMYEKALQPFIGMTAKSVLLEVPPDLLDLDAEALNGAVDRYVAATVGDEQNLAHGRSLAPLPLLGVPGWWPANEVASFYDNADYFRPGRLGAATVSSASTS